MVLDNLSAHKTKDVDHFLAQHPHVRFHFTPTYSSWLNQVELTRFAKIQRDVIRRGVLHFPSPISAESFAVTFASIPNQPSPFAGAIPIQPAESAQTKSPGQLTSASLDTLSSKADMRFLDPALSANRKVRLPCGKPAYNRRGIELIPNANDGTPKSCENHTLLTRRRGSGVKSVLLQGDAPPGPRI